MNRKHNALVSLTALVLLVIVLVTTCTGCKAQGYTDNTSYHAIVAMPDGSLVEGECSDSWAHSCGMVSVTIDGIEYRTHSTNVVWYREANK